MYALYFIYRQAKNYVHPTQNVLITAINQYIEQKIQNDALQKQIEILKGELSAKEEQIIALKNEKDIDKERSNLEEQQDFVTTIANQLSEITDKSLFIHNQLKQPQDDDDTNNVETRNKTSLSYDEIKEMDHEINDLRDSISDLSARLLNDDRCVLKPTPINEYVLTLKTISKLKRLYRLKFTELEKAKDAVI